MKVPMIVSALMALGVALSSTPAAAQTQAAAQPKKIAFLTNYTFHGRHSPFFVGLEKGYYTRRGLRHRHCAGDRKRIRDRRDR